jgi:pimeloyl-ACP methyl ester carboxylesterase
VTPLDLTGSGPAIVLVGGGLTGSLSWVPHAERLASTHRVARAQPIGVQRGLERARLPIGYSIRLEAEGLKAALDEHGLTQPVDVVGWSMGGTIALDFALRAPERVRTLTLIEPDVPWVLSSDERADPEVRKAEDDARRWSEGVSEDDLAAFLGEMLGADPRQHPRWPVWREHREALRAILAIYQHDDDPRRLAALDRPVLLVKGAGTARYNLMMVEALARALPRVRVVELPGGHMAPVAAIDEFLAALETFQRGER